ncbi:hypothetical protein Droror1_Dr00015819 [Drosera rotundifolia]
MMPDNKASSPGNGRTTGQQWIGRAAGGFAGHQVPEAELLDWPRRAEMLDGPRRMGHAEEELSAEQRIHAKQRLNTEQRINAKEQLIVVLSGNHSWNFSSKCQEDHFASASNLFRKQTPGIKR